MRIRTLIADDEPLARDRLRSLLARDPAVEIIGEATDGAQARDLILALAPELAFLDVQMPRFDGFAVVQSIPEAVLPVVVFVTAYDDYAVRAFDVHALDYLLKPYDEERFARTLSRAKARVARHRPTSIDRRLSALIASLHRTPRLERVAVTAGGSVHLLRTADVDWFQSAGNYVRAHVGGESHLLRRTLASLETELDPARFCRIHRTMIVNLDRIAALEPAGHGALLVTLRDGTTLMSSRAHGSRLHRVIGAS